MHCESRVDCIARFRVAVDWLNAHRSELLMKDCTNQTTRSGTVVLRESVATRVIELPDGHRVSEDHPRQPWSLFLCLCA